MRKFITRALWGTLIAGGITLLGATVANAAETTGDDGLLSGTQALVSITAPITVTGNAISVLGDSSSASAPAPASAAVPAPAPAATTSGSDGVGSGTQAVIPITLPITITGNAISVLGDATQAGGPAPAVASTPASAPAEATTSGEDSILGGTQVVAPIAAPIAVGGNAISVLGDSTVAGGGSSQPAAAASESTESTTASTAGDDAVLGGTQIVAPVTAPVTVGDNAIAVIGDGMVTGAAPVEGTDPPDGTDLGDGAESGNVGPAFAALSVTELAATGGANGMMAAFAGMMLAGSGLGLFASQRRAE